MSSLRFLLEHSRKYRNIEQLDSFVKVKVHLQRNRNNNFAQSQIFTAFYEYCNAYLYLQYRLAVGVKSDVHQVVDAKEIRKRRGHRLVQLWPDCFGMICAS